MTALEISAAELRFGPSVQPRPAPPLRDVASIARRALRRVPRELETVVPPVFIALFFFVVNIGTLQHLTESNIKGFEIKSFMLPTAVLLGVTGVSRAGSLVLDIQDGYLDRLLLTPVRRLAILVGHMAADVAIACTLMVPITALALALGVDFRSGPLGVAFFFLLGCAWSLAFAGFGYAIALKTGNPAAVNSSFLLFFPFLFMTSSYAPRSQLSGWLGAVAAWNPVTYVLEGLRSLVTQGWAWGHLGEAVLAIAAVAAVSMSTCLAALRSRTRRGHFSRGRCPSGARLFVVATYEPEPRTPWPVRPVPTSSQEADEMHHSICYEIYKVEHGLRASEQRARAVRSGEIAAAIAGPLGQMATRLRACSRWLKLTARLRRKPVTAREALAG